MALLARLDPAAQQARQAIQEEQPMSAGGGLCAQILMEQSSFTMALLQAVPIAMVAQPTTSAQQKELMLSTTLKLQLAMLIMPFCMVQNMKPQAGKHFIT